MAAGSGDSPRTAVPDGEPRTSHFDVSVANPARIWNYWLGGKDHYAADRVAGDHVLEAAPSILSVARADRAFLASAVRHLVTDLGVRQFLDVGTGLPAADNTHEVAQRASPESRIVYVDNDPVVLAHARALLTSAPEGATAYIEADARDTGKILAQAAETLDFSRPVAVMLLGVLLFIPDADDPWSVTAELMDAVPPGSYLTVSHGASDIQAEVVAAAGSRYNEHSAVPLRLRTREEFTRFFDGLELVGPGVVPINRWHPGPPPGTRKVAALPAYAALGLKAASKEYCMPSTAMRKRSVAFRYSRKLTAPRDAREETRRVLCIWGLEDHVEAAQVIVSELVTNAIRHGAGPVGTCLSHGPRHLRIGVHDDGPGRPVRRDATAEDECWRGLAVIDGMLQLYGGGLGVVDDEVGEGKTVYASIHLPDGQ